MSVFQGFTATVNNMSFEEVLTKVRDLSQEQRGHLLELYSNLVVDDLSRDVSLRVLTVRMLVALLPSSLDIIEKWVDNPRLYEIHFTLFCYLDWVAHWPDLLTLKKQILEMLETFLLAVKSNAGSAAWMAGDLLGDHWPADESASVLANVLNNARYVAGRQAALHGVEMLLAGKALNRQSKDAVESALRARVKEDRSLEVRRVAVRLHIRHTSPAAIKRLT